MPESYSFKINSSGNAAENVAKIKTGVSGLAGEMKGLATAALGIGTMFAGFSFFKGALTDFNKFQESNTKLKAAIQSTGGAAGISLGQFQEDAEKLNKTVLFPKSAIIEAESMLAMFTSIRGEMMSQTLPIAADLATKFGMDIPQAAKLLGRSLENLQLGRLQMQLGKMSDAQLLAIKNFKAMGETGKAQAVILDFVRDKIGGLSEAMTKTDSGKLEMAAKTLEDFKIQVGQLVSKFLVDLIPAFNTVVRIAKEFKEWVTGDSLGAELFRDAVVALGAAIGVYTIYTFGATAAQWLFNAALWASGIPELIIMVTGLAVAYMYLWDNIKVVREGVGGVFAVMAKWYKGLIELTHDLAMVLYDVFTGNFKKAIEDSKIMFGDFKKNLATGWKDTWKGGAEKAGNSTFRFENLIGLGAKNGLTFKDFGIEPGKTNLSEGGGGAVGAVAQSAINTSLLGGASGGLGEAKTIKIDFHKALMEINVPGGNGQDIINKAPLTMEMLLRILNNLAPPQGATM